MTQNISIDMEMPQFRDEPEEPEAKAPAIPEEPENCIPIKTADQLAKIGNGEPQEIDGKSYTFSEDGYYKIMDDIDLSTYQEGELALDGQHNWKPISNPFKGTLDGNNHTISNLHIDDSKNNEGIIHKIGLFSEINGGNVKDLTITVKKINQAKWTSGVYNGQNLCGVGAFAGVMNGGALVNCNVHSEKDATISTLNDNVGGLVGRANDIILKDCENNVPVSAGDSEDTDTNARGYNAGGIVGYASKIYVDNCKNDGKVTASRCNVGGIVGSVFGDNICIKNCTNNGEIASSDYNVGGIAGYISAGNTYISDCTSSGNVSVSKCNVGGIVGIVSCTNLCIRNCENKGTVTSNDYNAGGIVGYIGAVEIYISNCTSSGGVSANKSNVGGIAGYIYGSIKNVYIRECTSNGQVTGEYNVGGIIGSVSSANTYVYYCTNNAQVKASKCNAGGIVGNIPSGNTYIYYCTDSGQVTASEYNAGGIVGNIPSGNIYIYHCTNRGQVTASENNAGGIVGYVGTPSTYIRYCTNSGQVNESKYNVGGIIGYAYISSGNANISDCKNTGVVHSKESNAGGIIGCSSGFIVNNCTNDGQVSADNCNAGGLIGYAYTSAGYAKISGGKNTGVIQSKECNAGGAIGQVFIFNVQVSDFTNDGNVTSNSYNAGGIIGTSYQFVTLNSCTNNGEISSYGKAGGIISELRHSGQSTFTNCVNNGNINGLGDKCYSTAGIIAEGCADMIITRNCKNTGDVNNNNWAAGGIIGILSSRLTCNDCTNEGNVRAGTGLKGDGVNAGGIVGKAIGADSLRVGTNNFNSVSESSIVLQINDCINTGDIMSDCHLGGIVGMARASVVTISNCKTLDAGIVDNHSADRGGIIGFGKASTVVIDNCDVSDVELYLTGTAGGNTYGVTGGIAGNISSFDRSSGTTNISNVIITNCNVTDSDIIVHSHNMGGIIGAQSGDFSSSGSTIIYNCMTSGCNMKNVNGNDTYAKIGGIMGEMYNNSFQPQNYSLQISNCFSSDNIMQVPMGVDANLGGVLGESIRVSNIKLNNNIVSKCDIKNKANTSNCDYNMGGLAGFIWKADTANITSCDVVDTDTYSFSGNHGGILGLSQESQIINFSNCNVKECSMIQNCCRSSACQGIGGIIGGLCYNSRGFTISGCVVQDSAIKNSEVVGGMAGNGQGSISVYNSRVENTEIAQGTITKNYYAGTGGVIATATTGATITIGGVEVNDCYMHNEAVEGNLGGLIGFSWDCTITGSSVNGCKLEKNVGAPTEASSSKGGVGGLIGSNNSPAELSGCTVQDTKITILDDLVAGGVAYANSSITATDCSIKNVDIKCERSENIAPYGYGDGMAGFIGISYSNTDLTNINVQDVTLEGPIHNVGGICGYVGTLKSLTDCNVDGLNIDAKNIIHSSSWDEHCRRNDWRNIWSSQDRK